MHGHAHHSHGHAGHAQGHAHAGAHGHAEHDHHGHHHAAPNGHDRAFAIGIVLNTGFVLIEAGYGIASGSVSLLADAGHNLSDVLGLCLAWGGAALARRAPSKRFTYGLRGSSILAALFNALILVVALGAIAGEAVRRLSDPPPVAGGTMMAVAGAGIAVNAITALLFARGQHGDINLRGAYLHMLADALVSLGVVVAGGLILLTGRAWIDPVVSLAVALLIFRQTWQLLEESVEMSLAGVPRGIDFDAVSAALGRLPGVSAVHDLHIWPMSTTEAVLTAHLAMPGGGGGDAFLSETQAMLRREFGIGHATLQVETGQIDCDGC